MGLPLSPGVTLSDSPPAPPRRVRGGLEGRKALSPLLGRPPSPGWQLRESRVQGSEDSRHGAWLKYLKHIPAKPNDRSLEQEPDPEASGSHALSCKVRDVAPRPLLTVSTY